MCVCAGDRRNIFSEAHVSFSFFETLTSSDVKHILFGVGQRRQLSIRGFRGLPGKITRGPFEGHPRVEIWPGIEKLQKFKLF